MVYFFVTVTSDGVEREYVGHVAWARRNDVGLRTLQWSKGVNGETIGHETAMNLSKCLKMSLWRDPMRQRSQDARIIIEVLKEWQSTQ